MKKFLTVLIPLSLIGQSYAYTSTDLQKLKNDKEVTISSFSKRDKDQILEKYNDKVLNEKIQTIFNSTVLEFINDENKQCEADFYNRLVANFEKANIANDKDSIEEHLKMLRSISAIDDILFDIIASINRDAIKFKEIDLTKKPNKVFVAKHEERLEKNNVEDLYYAFNSWPDEKSSCSTQEFIRLKDSIIIPVSAKSSTKLTYMNTLNRKALEKKQISLETYNKLEFLRTKSNLEKRYVWLNDYFKIIFGAKNRMMPLTKGYEVKNLDTEDKYASERIKRFSRLTRRKQLYTKYNETQIILLAQVLQKASKRMGVDPDTITKAPYLVNEWATLNQSGERETYVERIEIDPQSQFNLARRLLRKDMVDLQMMSMFTNVDITYEDLVMASFEVGYITIEDLEYVVKYDDLWNPETSKYERVSKFVFTTAGYATFFLPPPFNVVTSIALGIVEGIADKKFNPDGAHNDNPGTFIE